jgi:hypothetical protein
MASASSPTGTRYDPIRLPDPATLVTLQLLPPGLAGRRQLRSLEMNNTHPEVKSLPQSAGQIVSPVSWAPLSPQEVACDVSLSVAERRALLASWASDWRAVANDPTLRRLDNGEVVPVDEVLRALKSLDENPDQDNRLVAAGSGRPFPLPRRKYNGFSKWLRKLARQRRSDDDDDPPPCPVISRLPPGGPSPLIASASFILETAA